MTLSIDLVLYVVAAVCLAWMVFEYRRRSIGFHLDLWFWLSR